MNVEPGKGRRISCHFFVVSASFVVALGFMPSAFASESDPLVPSRHMPRGPDAGVTNCSVGDEATTLATCQNDILSIKRQLSAWSAHHAENDSNGVQDNFLRLRMILDKQVKSDRIVMKQLRARLDGDSQATANAGSRAAETHKANRVWGGVELSTKPYTAPSDYVGIFSVKGSFTVPAMSVPCTANGKCDGTNAKNYAASWWIGIGGDPGGSIYQAGVKGVIICSVGSTTPAVTYLGWEDNYPFQAEEVDLEQSNGKIHAGDVITVVISSNFNTDPTGTGKMTYNLSDGTVTSGDQVIADGGYIPYQSAEAVVEREVEKDAGPPYYHSLPGTTLKATKDMFSGLTYDLVYETNANTGNPIKFTTVNDQDLNKSVGSGNRCSKSDTWCVGAFLNDTTKTECDVAIGSGPTTTTSGYDYTFVGQPETDGCYTPPP